MKNGQPQRLMADIVTVSLLIVMLGCEAASPVTSPTPIPAEPSTLQTRDVRRDPLNAAGLAIIRVREGDRYQEGIVDDAGTEVLQLSEHLLVQDLTGTLALVQSKRQFLFVPLDAGPITQADLDSVEGFQFAEPFRCGRAVVQLNDIWFYLNTDFEKAFPLDFEFAESFFEDRALVKAQDQSRIIDTEGKTVAELGDDQVSPQSPWCWQVTRREEDRYRSGFIDRNGQPITERIYDGVGYYDPEVKRIRVTIDDRHGFLNEHAKPAIPVIYEYAEIFSQGKAKVQLHGRTFFIDPDGKEVP